VSQYHPTPFSRNQSDSDSSTITRLIGWLKTQLARIAQAVNLESWYATTVTSAYTLTPFDRLLRVDTTGGAVAITLPLANTVPGQVFTIKNIGTNTVTVNRAGTDTIDGATSTTIPPLGTDTIIAATATRWDRVPGFGAGSRIKRAPGRQSLVEQPPRAASPTRPKLARTRASAVSSSRITRSR
jgi:hypothetical protein